MANHSGELGIKPARKIVAYQAMPPVNNTTLLHKLKPGRRHDGRIFAGHSREVAALAEIRRINMSQRRSHSKRRNRSGKGKAASTLLGNLLVELVGFATLLIVLFFVHTTPVESQPLSAISDHPASAWSAGHEFCAYVSELLGIPISFPN